VPGSTIDFTNGLISLAATGQGVTLTLTGDSTLEYQDDILQIFENPDADLGDSPVAGIAYDGSIYSNGSGASFCDGALNISTTSATWNVDVMWTQDAQFGENNATDAVVNYWRHNAPAVEIYQSFDLDPLQAWFVNLQTTPTYTYAQVAGIDASGNFSAVSGTFTGPAPTAAAGQVSFGNGTQTTVGAAGSASALPSAPTGYLIINVAGTERVIPFYAHA
jgi:hypothetical protein